MQHAPFTLITELIADPANGWSIGSLGAIGEFQRASDEPATIRQAANRIEIITSRGAIRVVDAGLPGAAWDTLSRDGESWGHRFALCAPRTKTSSRTVRVLGRDDGSIREEDRTAVLFDLGVAAGCVTMGIRTADPDLAAILQTSKGRPLLESPGAIAAILRSQPHRVLLSPAGRIEVYQPIPPLDGRSPEGPHTHLLPRLVKKNRPHCSNTSIPEGWQAALSMHPPSPWRTMPDERRSFDPTIDAAFTPFLNHFSSDEDNAVERDLVSSLDGERLPWPASRRGRHKARIVLRRLHAAGNTQAARWRALHDRASSPAPGRKDAEIV